MTNSSIVNSRKFNVGKRRYLHTIIKKVVNSYFSEYEDRTSTTTIIFGGVEISDKIEGEKIIRYLDRQGNVLKL
jgi:hypothetical protein